MLEQLENRVNSNPSLVYRGRYVSLTFLTGIGERDFLISIHQGKITSVTERELSTASGVFTLRASEAVWQEHWQAVPKRDYQDLFSLLPKGLLKVDGDLVPFIQNLQYFKDVLGCLRAAPKDHKGKGSTLKGDSATGFTVESDPAVEPSFEAIRGRYLNMLVAGERCRIYVEEAGSGIPLVCLHTAGSDSRQFRHLLNDPAITDRFRVVAFDLPWHGKSNPPVGFNNREYELTTDLYKQTVMSFCQALDLDQPVVMGCSMGGRIVLHLALEQATYFRAVIALEGADKLEAYYSLDWLNRPDVHGGEVSAAFVSSQLAPLSPVEYRNETLWHYKQSGPGIFRGDLYFYWHDGDFDDRSPLINTDMCPVYLLSGEYDCSCTPERTQATASRISGSQMTIMEGMGHFPMSENPQLFREYLLPVLDEIVGRQ